MSLFLGLDTSNYATSAAVYDSADGKLLVNERIELSVGKNQLGLRQNDAVFLHTRNLPLLLESVRAKQDLCNVSAVGVSGAPTGHEGSYMPCFLCGVAAASAFSAGGGAAVVRTDHQSGHITAAAFGAKRELFGKEFLAVHLSGGTTDLVRCDYRGARPKITPLAHSLDLHAGQCVDRVGAMLGMDFPAGVQLSRLAQSCAQAPKVRPVIRDGCCCLSGLENQCADLLKRGADPAYIARYCLDFIAASVRGMIDCLQESQLPVLLAGGVSASSVIRNYFAQPRYCFADPKLSADNAAGVAVIAARVFEKE